MLQRDEKLRNLDVTLLRFHSSHKAHTKSLNTTREETFRCINRKVEFPSGSKNYPKATLHLMFSKKRLPSHCYRFNVTRKGMIYWGVEVVIKTFFTTRCSFKLPEIKGRVPLNL